MSCIILCIDALLYLGAASGDSCGGQLEAWALLQRVCGLAQGQVPLTGHHSADHLDTLLLGLWCLRVSVVFHFAVQFPGSERMP